MDAVRGWRLALANIRWSRLWILLNLAALQIFVLIRERQMDKIYRKETLRSSSSRRLSYRRLTNTSTSVGEVGTTVYRLVEARSELPSLDPYLRPLYRTVCYINWYLLAKNILICMLRSQTFASLRFLDCFLVGRLLVNGRVIDVASTCACYLITMSLFWYYLLQGMQAATHLPCIEFLLKHPNEVFQWDCSRSSERTKAVQRAQRRYQSTSHEGDLDQWHSSIFEMHNPFESLSKGHNGWTYKLRPNRTQKAWSNLLAAITRFNLTVLPALTIIVAFFLRMTLPLTFTQDGYELSYRFCINWLRSAQNSSLLSPNLESRVKEWLRPLVRPSRLQVGRTGMRYHPTNSFKDRSTVILMPFVRPVDFNTYQVVRIMMDLLDCMVIYCSTVILLTSMSFIATLLVDDLVFYSDYLNKRLEQQIRTLRWRSKFKKPTLDDIFLKYNYQLETNILDDDIIVPTQLSYPRMSKSIQSSSVITQAQVADLFIHMKHYNRYIRYQTLFLVTLWLSYSALVTSWIFLPGNDSPKMEWYILHVFATIFLFYWMSRFSEVKAHNYKLHKRICIIMALDNESHVSKVNWMSLIQFYSPIPLYCFTFLSKTVLDVMFGLKLLAWLASALIVTASFFSVYSYR